MEYEKIEEIAKELCPHYDNGNCYYEVTEVCECCCGCEFCWAVSQVLNAGYRKIPKGHITVPSLTKQIISIILSVIIINSVFIHDFLRFYFIYLSMPVSKLDDAWGVMASGQGLPAEIDPKMVAEGR